MDRIRQDRSSESSTPSWTWDARDAEDGRVGQDDGWAGDGRRGQWAGENPFWRPPGERGPDNDTRARDWFGNAIPTDEPVPCPFCRQPFSRLAEYEDHLRDAHHFRNARPEPRAHRAAGLTNAIGVVRFIPSWLVLLVGIGFWVMLGFYWFVGVLAFLALVLWTQTSSRFRNR
jgi:hypothetical protein